MKYKRHAKILQLISDDHLTTQEEITARLKEEGFEATQATVSRDIKELGLIKVSASNGNYKYIHANVPTTNSSTKHMLILTQAMIGITYAMHTVVIRTHAGMAQAAGAAVDDLVGNEILGSIGGDDTLMLICQNEEESKKVVNKLRNFLKIGAD